MSEIYTYLPGIILAYTAFCLGLLSPGPNILAVIGTSMGTGRAEGKALALGISAGSLCWGRSHHVRHDGNYRNLRVRHDRHQDCRRVVSHLARVEGLAVGGAGQANRDGENARRAQRRSLFQDAAS